MWRKTRQPNADANRRNPSGLVRRKPPALEPGMRANRDERRESMLIGRCAR
jgi:hypothetical protein